MKSKILLPQACMTLTYFGYPLYALGAVVVVIIL
jgi:hypothetical protein